MKKTIFVAFLSLMVLSVGAQPTFAAENIFQKAVSSVGNSLRRFYLTWIPGDKPGTSVLNQAMVATQQLKTAQVNSQITADLFHDEQSQGNVKIVVQGPAQMQPQVGNESAKQELNIDAEFTLQGTTLHLAADTKVAGNTFYFKLNQVPALPSVDLSSVTGKWYKTTSTTATASAQLSADQKEQLSAAMMKLTQSAQAGTAHADTKGDHSVYVVDVTIPRAALQEYLNTAISIQSEANPSQDANVTTKIQETLKKNTDTIGDLKGTLWVDKSSFYVRHIEVPITYLMPAQSDPIAESSTMIPLAALSQINKAVILVKADLDNFDQPIQFVEPTDALDAKEAFAASFGRMMSPGMQSSEGTSELPTLTPYQKTQLQKLNSISPEQKQKFLDQLNSMEKLKTTPPVATP